MKKPLIVIAGPTASGKTSISIALAKAIGGEIISADSMQVYRGMDIGTAKVTVGEMKGIKHHLIDVLEPNEGCSIVKWQQMVKIALEDVYSRGKIPIIAGGTGFYIQSIIYDIDFEENDGDKSYRDSLEALAEEIVGTEKLHRMLEKVDKESAKAIHMNNVKRVIRALEYYNTVGEPISEHNERESQKKTPYDLAFYVLTMDRELLYQRINTRVDRMIDGGLVEEVKGLLEKGYSKDLVAMQGLGYKEIIPHLEGECTLEESIDILKRDTRRFAKRQLTWFRRDEMITWIDVTDFIDDQEEILSYLIKDVDEKTIL